MENFKNNLSNYLKENILYSTCISRGISNNVYKIKLEDRELILKHPNVNGIFEKRSCNWEYKIQKNLSDFFPVPQTKIFCHDNSVIGFPFFIMENVDGEKKYDSLYVEKSFELLNDLHNIPLTNLMKNKIKKENSLEKNINKLYQQYYSVQGNQSSVYEIMLWLIKNIPEEKMQCFVHNDWKMSNIIFEKNGSGVVLDWEISDVGDPRTDLGIAMAYWSQKADEEEYDYSLDKTKIIDKFFKNKNFYTNSWKFFEVYGIFRLITIAELASYRYKSGIIDDVRFSKLDSKIKKFVNSCERIIKDG